MNNISRPRQANGAVGAYPSAGRSAPIDIDSSESEHLLDTRNALMQRLNEQLSCYAQARATVLIDGESGTGKGVLARAIHRASDRCDGPFVSLDCASTAEGILESALFGHEKGAFTGAVQQYIGRFEQAHGGTLFIDEIGTASAQVQLRLLRVLQERAFERVGGARTVRVDVRVIAATNVDLRQRVEAGEFREDLFYRLNVLPLRLPALRERREDIPQLIELFLHRACSDNQRSIQGVETELMERLQDYDWPGNIRQLENVIECMVVCARGDYLKVADLPAEVSQCQTPAFKGEFGLTLREARLGFEREYLCKALQRRNGVIAQVAQDAGMSRKNLYMKLDNLQIDYQRFRSST